MIRAIYIVVALASTACSSSHPDPTAADGPAADGSIALDCGSKDGEVVSPTTGNAVQMNDVTVLFPMLSPSSSYLPASAAGVGGPLLPEALYNAVGTIGGPADGSGTGVGVAAYRDLRVVAMRLDPCFAALDPDPHGEGCTDQLRLVVQDLGTDPATPLAADSALHLFYKISRAELYEIVATISTAREQAAPGQRLGALAPHPIMTSQGLTGTMAHTVCRLVLAHAGAANLTRVAKLSATDQNLVWSFDAFDVGDATAPAITPMVIPTLGAATAQQFARDDITQRAAPSANADADFTPATTSTDDLSPLADPNTAILVDDAERQAAFSALVHVDDPRRHSPNTIDCGSCHLATPAEQTVAKPIYGLDEQASPEVFTADGVYVLASEMASTFPQGALDIHAFSYLGQAPAINQRTVNETARIVAYLNQNPL